jgi:hypothetical protein
VDVTAAVVELMARALPSPAPNVIARDVGDGSVLFNMATETYFGLNAVGARIWRQLAAEQATVGALCSELALAYPDVPLEQLVLDTCGLLDALEAEQLVLAAGSTG